MRFRLLFICLFVVVFCSFGQESFTKSKYFGLEFGANFSTFLVNPTGVYWGNSFSGKNGLIAGISNEKILKPKMSIKYGFFYERKGAISDSYYPVKLNYLVIPILFSYNNLAGMYCNVGPYLGVLPQNYSVYKRVDFGGVFGVGVKFKISQNSLFEIGVKESLGLMNITSSESSKFRNNSISLNFAIRFKFD